MVSLLFWRVVLVSRHLWGVGQFASAFCQVFCWVDRFLGLSQKEGGFKIGSPSAVLGWFVPLLVLCFGDLGGGPRCSPTGGGRV